MYPPPCRRTFTRRSNPRSAPGIAANGSTIACNSPLMDLRCLPVMRANNAGTATFRSVASATTNTISLGNVAAAAASATFRSDSVQSSRRHCRQVCTATARPANWQDRFSNPFPLPATYPAQYSGRHSTFEQQQRPLPLRRSARLIFKRQEISSGLGFQVRLHAVEVQRQPLVGSFALSTVSTGVPIAGSVEYAFRS